MNQTSSILQKLIRDSDAEVIAERDNKRRQKMRYDKKWMEMINEMRKNNKEEILKK